MKVAPFDWNTGPIERDPVPVDAIPDLGDNQQIVFTEYSWALAAGRRRSDHLPADRLAPGRSRGARGAQLLDVRLLVCLPDLRGGHRVLLVAQPRPREAEQPASQSPSRRGDAFPRAWTPPGSDRSIWYVLEGRDPDGKPIGGWDVDELRSIQDWQVRYALLSAQGVAEVASVGRLRQTIPGRGRSECPAGL